MHDESPKVPSQIFKWFERMKENYDQSIQGVLKQFETYSHAQQERIDKVHKQHISQGQLNNEQLSKQYENQIAQLNKDVTYYRQQIDKQQQNIEALNTRYDNVIRCMLPNKRENNIKDIFAEHDFVTPINNTLENTSAKSETIDDIEMSSNVVSSHSTVVNESNLHSQDELFDQAIIKRQSGESDQAFMLFEQAAKLGHVKSMGAMGRSFFLGEGTVQNSSLGLAWLINASNNELPQAVDRVKHFAEHDPELYEEALIKSAELL